MAGGCWPGSNRRQPRGYGQTGGRNPRLEGLQQTGSATWISRALAIAWFDRHATGLAGRRADKAEHSTGAAEEVARLPNLVALGHGKGAPGGDWSGANLAAPDQGSSAQRS